VKRKIGTSTKTKRKHKLKATVKEVLTRWISPCPIVY